MNETNYPAQLAWAIAPLTFYDGALRQTRTASPKDWSPLRRVKLAGELHNALDICGGRAWLEGGQLFVQPRNLAEHFAPLIRELKSELVMILED